MRHLLTATCTAALLLAAAPPARAGLLGNDFDGILYDIDPATGAATNPRLTGLPNLAGIEFDAATNTLYGLTTFNGIGVFENSLFRIDPATGTPTLIGATGLVILEGGLGIDPTTGTLYGLQGGARELFTLNTATGAATVVGSIPSGDTSALAFDAAGNLFVLDTVLDTLLEVNKADGSVIDSTPLSTGLGVVAGFDYDPTTGAFYVADGGSGTNNLYTLNTTTGVLTLVGPTGVFDGLAGLTFVPGLAAVPRTGVADPGGAGRRGGGRPPAPPPGVTAMVPAPGPVTPPG